MFVLEMIQSAAPPPLPNILNDVTSATKPSIDLGSAWEYEAIVYIPVSWHEENPAGQQHKSMMKL